MASRTILFFGPIALLFLLGLIIIVIRLISSKGEVKKTSWLSDLAIMVGPILIFLILILVLPRRTPQSHRGSYKARCRSHLKQLTLACRVYASDNDGKFPTDLILLYNNPDGIRYIDSPAVFHCPGDSDSAPRNIANSFIDGVDSCQVSYRYFLGLDEKSSPEAILLEDNSLANHQGMGKHVVRVNGSVTWVPASSP